VNITEQDWLFWFLCFVGGIAVGCGGLFEDDDRRRKRKGKP